MKRKRKNLIPAPYYEERLTFNYEQNEKMKLIKRGDTVTLGGKAYKVRIVSPEKDGRVSITAMREIKK